ncbi:MAG: acetyl-CoA hydrolase [Alcanivoracaceae bacterium]|nr:acetyl-CoA hydrolase [Alcanivoracaceae bacterium]
MTVNVLNVSECIEHVIANKGRELIVGTPLGIGKPNPLLNAIWQKAKYESDLKLEIFTALSLQVPKGKSLLEKNFLKPFTDRLFPKYPDLDYIDDVKHNNIPANMKLTEFYMQSGKMLGSSMAQRNYTSSNYTHAARDMMDKGLNVLMQMVAIKYTESGVVYSLCSNTDLTLDIVAICKRKGLDKPCMVAMVNPNMPFMAGDAQVDNDFFDVILDDKSLYFQPFATPRAAVNMIDYNIGLLTSSLIKDGGTMQIGIGSLGDALIYCTKLRHQNNVDYLKLLDGLHITQKFKQIIAKAGSLSVFKQGLYAASEMFVEGFAHLFNADILKRKVYPDAQVQTLLNQGVLTEKIQKNVIEILLQNNILDEFITKKQMLRLQYLGILKSDLQMFKGYMQDSVGNKYDTDLFHYENIQAIQNNCLGEQLNHGTVLHGAFFLGSRWFYQWLHNLNDKHRDLFQMTAVSQVNELYGGEALDRVQRINARFINTCMKVDLLGAAASDTLDNNQVVSGVGGQYNFVAMAQALEDSRSILMLRSTHQSKGGVVSNVVWKYSYCTIPRHLRDIVVTEYGIADLRGQSDEDCIKRMICIADSQFQNELRQTAIKYHKLDPNWSIPELFKNNTVEYLESKFVNFLKSGYFPQYPFGSDFSDEELVIIEALKFLKANTKTTFEKIRLIIKASLFSSKNRSLKIYLARMGLLNPQNTEEKISYKLLKYALDKTI